MPANDHPLFLVLTAPSGAGKSTLVRMLREEFPAIVYSVSCTTRAPRGEEKDGVAYHFLSDEEFLRRVAAGEFLEHALVHGHRYGTLRSAVEGPLAEGRWVVLDIDVAGAADVPSIEELRRRLEKRGEDAPEVIETRLRNAEGERARKGEFSAVVVNDDLATAYAELRAAVLAKTGSPDPAS